MQALDRLIDEGEDLTERVAALVAELKLLKASLSGSDTSYVRADGRLSEIGIRYCYAAFEEGKGPSEIARHLGVTVPAVISRRKSWDSMTRAERRKQLGK